MHIDGLTLIPTKAYLKNKHKRDDDDILYRFLIVKHQIYNTSGKCRTIEQRTLKQTQTTKI